MQKGIRGEAGFSLMEVMIAVGIGALMVAVLTVGLSSSGYKAKVARVKADLKAIEGALHQYESDNGSYPVADQGLQALVDGSYLERRKLPEDPWKNPYVYVVPGPDNMAFDVMSYGADKGEGGEGNNKDLKLSEIE